MANIIPPVIGTGNTTNLPNFHGELMQLSPEDTPFLSAIGGLSGGKEIFGQTEWEWQYEDIGVGNSRSALEGADSPSAEEFPRANGSNALQIVHRAVSVTYRKQAATQMYAGLNAGGQTPNPVGNELQHQINLRLKRVGLDLDYDFLNGEYVKQTAQNVAPQTRGLIPAIRDGVTANSTTVSNLVDVSQSAITNAALAAASGTFTSAAHGLANGTQVTVSGVGMAQNGYRAVEVFYVVNTATNTFKLARSSGGAAVVPATDIQGVNGQTGDIASGITIKVTSAAVLTKTQLLSACQLAWQNGGLSQSGLGTILVGAAQKVNLTNQFLTLSNFFETRTDGGGLNVQTIETDFGRMNIMLSRNVPQSAVVIASLDACAPVFLNTPGKGHLFLEPLGKKGSKDEYQLYGEVGLEYGSPLYHGLITNAKV